MNFGFKAMKNKIIIVVGPTAVGKTKYGVDIAKYFDSCVVSCDSMQVYKKMSIGSAKPTLEEQKGIKHYLIDEVDPKIEFSVAEYSKLAINYIDQIISKGKTPVIVGGTGLYVNSIIYNMDFSNTEKNNEIRIECEKLLSEKGTDALYNKLLKLDPDAENKVHKNNTKRVIRAIERIKYSGNNLKTFEESKKLRKKYEPVILCLSRDRDELYERINQRVDIMMEEGLLDEVKSLLNDGLDKSMISMKGIGYKEIIDFLEGNLTLEEAVDKIKQSSRRYAKRQLTWFRKYSKDGLDIKWFNLTYESEEEVFKWLREKL